MAHLSSSAIFSPSVARQQLAAAKDWNYIDGWLTSKFNGRPAPPFERNNDTLKALLVLAALNENADEDRELLSRVEARSLDELQARAANDPNADLMTNLEDGLTSEGKMSLEALAAAAVVLNQPYADAQGLAQKIVEMQVASFDLDQAAERVAILERELKRELQEVTAILDDLRSEAYQPSSDLSKQTQDYQRKTKILAAKLPELKDRLTSLSAAAGAPSPTIQDIQVEEKKYEDLLATLKKLEAQVKSFHGLPHDTDLARLELEQLRVDLKEITLKRDGMFEGLVERESPKKYNS